MIHPLTETLLCIGHGIFVERASKQLAQMVCEIEAHGDSKAAGTLTIVLRVVRANTGNALVVEVNSTARPPKATPDAALLWASVEGILLKRDPAQIELQLDSRIDDAPEAMPMSRARATTAKRRKAGASVRRKS